MKWWKDWVPWVTLYEVHSGIMKLAIPLGSRDLHSLPFLDGLSMGQALPGGGGLMATCGGESNSPMERRDGLSLNHILFSVAKQPGNRSCLGVHQGTTKMDDLHAPQEQCCLFHIGNSLKPSILEHSNFVGSSIPEEMSPFGHCESIMKSSISFGRVGEIYFLFYSRTILCTL